MWLYEHSDTEIDGCIYLHINIILRTKKLHGQCFVDLCIQLNTISMPTPPVPTNHNSQVNIMMDAKQQ